MSDVTAVFLIFCFVLPSMFYAELTWLTKYKEIKDLENRKKMMKLFKIAFFVSLISSIIVLILLIFLIDSAPLAGLIVIAWFLAHFGIRFGLDKYQRKNGF